MRTQNKIPGPDSGIEIRKSICAICDPMTQCGLDLYVKDGKIIKVEGDKDQPYGQGKLCAKGAAIRQYVYSDQRIKTPLRRVGKRGEGKFEPISWEDALDEVAWELIAIKEETGPESVSFFSGYSKFYRPWLKRLCHSFGSPNYLSESSTCFQAMAMAQQLVFGAPGSPDWGGLHCLLVWSANPFFSNHGAGRQLLAALDRGMKLIVVDPRRSPTADKAHIHLRLRPGTDGALALAMANIIISEDLYDKDFVTNHTLGFDEYKTYVSGFTPEKGEALTGVPAAKIREAARLFAKTRPGAVMPSASAVVHNTNGVQNYRAVFSLIGLTGNYDVKGGQFVNPPSLLHLPGRFTTRENEFMQSRPYSEMAERMGENRFPVWNHLVQEESQAMVLPEQIRTQSPYPIRALVGQGMNYRMWPDSNGMREALTQLDFYVNTDLFLTDTCKMADIVLPACSSVERSEIRCWSNGYVVYTTPAITPLYESRSNIDIMSDLAKRICPEDELLTAGFDACVDWMLEPSGLTVDELKKHPGGMFVPNPNPLPERKYLNGGFKTPSGKLEFVSTVLEKYQRPGVEALPVYTPPKYSPEGSPELAKEYPLILNTGSRLPMFVHTRTFRMPWATSLRPDFPAADLNPEDAKNHNISQGDTICIATPKGSIHVKANLTQMVLPGVVHMYHGHSKADVNTLMDWDYLDPISGYPGFKSMLCKIKPVKEA